MGLCVSSYVVCHVFFFFFSKDFFCKKLILAWPVPFSIRTCALSTYLNLLTWGTFALGCDFGVPYPYGSFCHVVMMLSVGYVVVPLVSVSPAGRVHFPLLFRIDYVIRCLVSQISTSLGSAIFPSPFFLLALMRWGPSLPSIPHPGPLILRGRPASRNPFDRRRLPLASPVPYTSGPPEFRNSQPTTVSPSVPTPLSRTLHSSASRTWTQKWRC